MKYLKLFKESKEDYYVEMSKFDHDNSTCIKPITKNTFDYIQNILFKSIYSVSNLRINDKNNYLSYRGHFWHNISFEILYICDVFISELEDEYFLVSIFNPGSKILPQLSNKLFYKCDQLDGVKELLIDKGIIKA